MQLTDIGSLADDAEFQQRCTFCDGREEAWGELGVEIAPGQFMELPIGPACLESAKKIPAKWVDKPGVGVVE